MPRTPATKAEGEAAVLAEFPSAIILRPSIVFGPEDQFFNRFAAMARISPVLPLIGGGRTKFQPVFVGDVGQAAANAAIERQARNDLRNRRPAGPDASAIFSNRRCAMPTAGGLLPHAVLAREAAGPADLAASQLAAPDHASIRFGFCKLDNVVSEAAKREGRTSTALGVARPASIDAIVPEYLERFKPKGQYASYPYLARARNASSRPTDRAALAIDSASSRRCMRLIQRRNRQFVFVRMADSGLKRVRQRDRCAVGCVQREERYALRQAFDLRKHVRSLRPKSAS